ncbi:MAG TPA: phosphoesterase [Planctomycetota bacterium]|nr:phosphoesterase [Planctomycetota bacterium]
MSTSIATDPATAVRDAVAGFDPDRPTLVAGHFDADGLAACAIIVRMLAARGREAATRIVGRGESIWSADMRRELAARRPGSLVVVDLGVGDSDLVPGVPTLVIDHHVPRGEGGSATVVSGHGIVPEPPSALLAYRGAVGLTDPDPWAWLAALGIIGDLADGAGFPELAVARARHGITALRETVALVNAARRAAAADAAPALALLLRCDGPREVIDGGHPETAVLRAARAEVRRALDAAARAAPTVRGGVALVRIASPCQIHPLLAQRWRQRLRGLVVVVANTGYRPGWVHMAARGPEGVDLVRFFADHRPPGADDLYGGGHRGASGGALRVAAWNAFAAGLGFPEQRL